MKAEDDYLWDGSGEPDPDVARLEGLLSEFRHKAPAPSVELPRVIPFRARRLRTALLAAAAILVTALVIGVTYRVAVRDDGELRATINGDLPGDDTVGPPTAKKPEPPVPAAPPVVSAPPGPVVTPTRGPRTWTRLNRDVVSPVRTVPEAQLNDLALASSPVVDNETATHFERAKLLLTSFENARATGDDETVDVSYERERSKTLLAANRTLRRNAEVKGNLPMEDALSALEPFLVDISNLEAAAKKDDVSNIQTRLEQRGIDSELQLYAANRPGAGM